MCPVPKIPRDQLIYWSPAWLAEEAETRKALAEGKGRTFSNAQEVIHWLLEEIPQRDDEYRR